MNKLGQTRTRMTVALLMAGLIAAPFGECYELPLASRSVREGYFLGQRNDEKTSSFLAAYVKRYPLPQKGPYISEIELLTPYAQVVDISRKKTAGYSAQQAEHEYKERGDTILVRVRIELTPTYGELETQPAPKNSGAEQRISPRPNDFWRDFRYRLAQKDETIEPVDVYGEAIYYTHGSGSGGLRGAMVWLTYDAKEVESAMATIEILAPDQQRAVADFDLEKLR